MKKIVHIVGTRPNYVKAAPVINAINFGTQTIINTGQHYDKSLSADIIQSLGMRIPDINLKIPTNIGVFERLSHLMEGISKQLLEIKPDIVILYGDVDSTLAASLVASRLLIPTAHVEAGLRSFDDTMPEEINRKIVDRLASLHFVTERSGLTNLNYEGYSESVHFVGNTMIDSLVSVTKSDAYRKSSYKNNDNILLTCHRPFNVDTEAALQNILKMCQSVDKKIVWPVHPRTAHKMQNSKKLSEAFKNTPNLDLIEPLDYCSFLKMMATSRLVITDSGGIQEETTYLKIPCLTIRPNTERPITIEVGSNTLSSFSDVPVYVEMVYKNEYKTCALPPKWDGSASTRIAEELLNFRGDIKNGR